VTIRDNYFQTVDGGGCASAIKFAGASANSVVERNYIHGDYSAAGLDAITAAGTFMLVQDNVMWNTDTTAGLASGLHAGTTGSFVRNLAFGGKNGTSAFSACAAMLVAENYQTNAAGASGVITPAVDV